MIDVELDAIEAMANAASRGPWASVLSSEGVHIEDDDEQVVASQLATEQDATFIMAARSDTPALVAELRAARKRLTDMTAGDVTECWPQQWRDEFREGNRVIEANGDTPLTPAAFLLGRYEDARASKDRRAGEMDARRHELLVAIVQSAGALRHGMRNDMTDFVKHAEWSASRIYPKPAAPTSNYCQPPLSAPTPRDQAR